MKRKFKIATICFAVVLACLIITAQERVSSESRLARLFHHFDRNGDGKLTLEEVRGAPWFERLDLNRDGILTLDEVEKRRNSTRSRPRSRSRSRSILNENGLKMPTEVALTAYRNIQYSYVEGVDPKLLSLDVYTPKNTKADDRRPVLIMIHGGGWRRGDKGNPPILGAKLRHFVGEGYVYIAINYRLSPAEPGKPGVRHPTHIQDSAKALAWVHEHIQEYGGDPEQIHLMGHSAGGHLAALLATNDRFLRAEGKTLDIIKTCVVLDTAAYDIPRYLRNTEGRGMRVLYENAFGTDETVWRDASPAYHVAPGKGIPPMLIFYNGDRRQVDTLAPAFADALTNAGSPSTAVDTVDLDHGQINSHVGMIGDPMTKLIMRFHGGEDALNFPTSLKDKEFLRSQAGTDLTVSNRPMVHFERSYVSGNRDGNGRFMGGTETMRLVAHAGMLFAGIGYWTDYPGNDPRPGAQILVKRGSDIPWEVAQNFPGALRISAMESLTFTTDYTGKLLPQPVTLLVADAALLSGREYGPLRCFVRNDATGQWVESLISKDVPRALIRAFGIHHDRETGVDLIFAGTGAGEIYTGAYDPNVPGQIRWRLKPEYRNPDFDGGPFRRCQGFCVANGKAYASIAPRLLERRDGPKPRWIEVFRWHPQNRAGAGLRGITAVPALEGNHQIILGSRQQEGRILRIDPTKNYKVELELESHRFLEQQWGGRRGGKLVAYNRFVPGKHPRTGKPIHWVTIAAVKPGDRNATWLLIRNSDASYEMVRVFDSQLEEPRPLISTRTIEISPWSEEEIYTGGYDGAANNRRNHNTAWIYKGTLARENDRNQ